MNFINRALLSIRKRFSRSIILFLAVLLICNVMAGSISIKKALETTGELYGKAMPIVVSIEENYDGTERESLSPLLVTELGKSPYVKDYSYYYSYYLQSKSLKLNNLGFDTKEEISEGSIAYIEIKGAGKDKIGLFESGTLTLIEGRTFNETEITKPSNSIIISKEIAEYNNLSIGDFIDLGYSITILDGDYGFVSEKFEIVGIFEAKKQYEKDPDGNLYEMANVYLDTMFMPNDSVKNIHDKIQAEMSKHGVDRYDTFRVVARYYLNTKDDFDNFKNENMAKLPKGFIFADNSKNLTTLEAPIQNMEDISNTIVYASIIVSVVVISLIIILFMKERKQEMGIYLALGERKRNIAFQIMLETLIISFVAITLSIGTGNMLAKNISERTIKNELSNSNVVNEKKAYGDDTPVISEEIREERELEIACEVTLDAGTILYIYIVALSSIIVSTIIPIGYTLKFNPRKILM